MSLINSFRYAIQGLRVAFQEQRNLKIHFVAAVLVFVVAYVLNVSRVDWIILTITVGWVISMELVNTVMEELVNLVSPQRQPLAGKIKDISAAAVLVSAGASVIIAALVFTPYLTKYGLL